ncbi:clock controlled protein [Drechmeria coniospora]|uniref:Clock controlled protein n=1 Tax=Drechmeria coniospora TaxID=98403 RepID=A0A151GJA1_DRECN|nr:clock controlled protein [Drechmeria coniospora]KYK57203.1 clock controlled protein [Drechmeria coniospora]
MAKDGGDGEASQKQAEPADAALMTPRSRRLSSSTVDTLPAYDDQRSPAYTETAGPQDPPKPTSSSAPWQNRLIMSTSGLSVAMSAESLRSLKYCLRWLRWSNDHMSRVIGNLKTALEEYEQTDPAASRVDAAKEAVDGAESEAQASGQKTPEESRAELAHKINFLKLDVLKTLQESINTVSKYTGGALPENARVLVHRHLTTLPQRFRVATMSNAAEGADRDSESAIREGAQKILVLAKEGLDMVTQIIGVVDGTIVSAEQWCERFGKKRRPSTGDDEAMTPRLSPSGDVKMDEAEPQ